MLFHFHVPGFSGGFAGVDVFFVISGYLMTSIIVTARSRGEFTIESFLLARAGRIFPALFVLVAVVLVVALVLLPPVDVRSIARYAAYALMFWSNQILASEDGYFATASNENVFLHTWSLSLEWQFYLLLPLILIGRAKIHRNAWVILVTALVASAVYSVLEPSTGVRFFSLGARAWELAAGGLIFLATLRPSATGSVRPWRRVAAWIGLAIILASFRVVDESMSWPMPWALLPVGGTCIVIAAASDASIFGWKAIQALGRWSYSVYLWHWPCVVALRMLHRQSEPGWIIFGIALSILLGCLSYRLVEDPARRWLRSLPLRRSALVACGWLAAVGVAGGIVKADGLPQREPQLARGLRDLQLAEIDSTFPPQCANWRTSEELKLCELHSEVVSRKAWLVVGDSHAQHYWPYFDARVKHRRVDFMTSAGCAPLPGLNVARRGFECPRVFDRVRELVDTGHYDRVIFASWWNIYFDGRLCVWQDARCQARVADIGDAAPSFEALRATWREWRARGIAVNVVLPEPTPGFNQPRELARRRHLGLDASPAESIPANNYLRHAGPVGEALERTAKLAGASLIDPADQLCHEGRCWFVDEGRQPIARDSNHLRATWVALGMHYLDRLLSESPGEQQISRLDSEPRRQCRECEPQSDAPASP